MSDIAEAVAELQRATDQALPDGRWDASAGTLASAAMAAGGWLQVGLPEELGGDGGDLSDTLEVVHGIASVGWPSPAPDYLLSVLLQRALGIRIAPEIGPSVVVPVAGSKAGGGLVDVERRSVPWAGWASHLLVLSAADSETRVSYVPTPKLPFAVGRGVGGSPTADVRLSGGKADFEVIVDRPLDEVIELARCAGALLRSVQMVAAIEQAETLTVAHVSSRQQFGRELEKFQAVQQLLAILAAESAAARAALTMLTAELRELDDIRDDRRIAIAKTRIGLAGTEVARISHQLHGAIGTTTEYALHRYTTAIWAWRDEFGNEFSWSTEIARSSRGVDVWAWITADDDS